MEALLVRPELEGQVGHYHDASHHGYAWAILNGLLHVIVSIFSLFGMIQFEVKFIPEQKKKFVKWASRAIIVFNFYVSLKFALLASTMFLYNHKLESQSIEISALNCSLANFSKLLRKQNHASHRPLANSSANFTSTSWFADLEVLDVLVNSLSGSRLLPRLTWLVDTYGGPYKYLGNRATLMYGVYAIGFYIMQALFPYELITEVEVGFNFIRFVLSDPACMRDLYENRKKHLARLAGWSRTDADSMFTQGAKMILSHRDLRTNYTAYCSHLSREGDLICQLYDWHEQQLSETEVAGGWRAKTIGNLITSPLALAVSKLALGRRRESPALSRLRAPVSTVGKHVRAIKGDEARNRPGGYILAAPVRQLKTRAATIGQGHRPSANVAVALRNLRHFKPFVRSETWFKASMVIYPCFIIFYTLMLAAFIGILQFYVDSELRKTVDHCSKLRAAEGLLAAGGGEHDIVEYGTKSWSRLDWLLYFENFYLLTVVSCGTGFYCSYYFGTIVELSVWLSEIAQQLALSEHVIEISDVLAHHTRAPVGSIEIRKILREGKPLGVKDIDQFLNEFGGFRHLFARSRYWWKYRTRAPSKTKLRELMAARLLDKKETLLRAAYVNLCLFLDELNETRFMTTTIMSRTTLIVSGWALMASITRSQFRANYGNLYYLLISAFLIFNVYLACGAYINSRMNEMLVQIHSLICASLRAGSEDADLLEFWLRHVNSFGQDKNTTAYEIYGYKITWSAVLNIDSVILSLYFITA